MPVTSGHVPAGEPYQIRSDADLLVGERHIGQLELWHSWAVYDVGSPGYATVQAGRRRPQPPQDDR